MKSDAVNPKADFTASGNAASVSVNFCCSENFAVGASLSANLLPVSGCAATKFGAGDLVGDGVGSTAAHWPASANDDFPHRLHCSNVCDDVTLLQHRQQQWMLGSLVEELLVVNECDVADKVGLNVVVFAAVVGRSVEMSCLVERPARKSAFVSLKCDSVL
jgi:hypothetical protein